MADNWEIFVRLHRDEVLGIVRHTPLYNFMAVRFPVPFITKLISTVRSSSDQTTVISAAAIIKDVARMIYFRQKLNCPTTTVETISFLRRSAIDLILHGLQECGKVLVSQLLCSALENGVVWGEFLYLARRSLFFVEESGLRSWILDVIYDQPDLTAIRFMRILDPFIREDYAKFPPVMIALLEAGNDHRLYRILAYACGLFTVQQWSTLMELAIMSSIFDDVHVLSSTSRVSAAIALRHCIDHGPEIHYYPHMISKLQAIISRLYTSSDHWESKAGLQLYEAFARRILKLPIPRRY